MELVIDATFIAVLAVGIALAGLLLRLQQDTRRRIEGLERRVQGVEQRVQGVETGVAELRGFISGITSARRLDQNDGPDLP